MVMKTESALLTGAGIGALELKQQYQRNMLLAVVIAAGTALGLLGAAAFYTVVHPIEEKPVHTIIINPDNLAELLPVGRMTVPPPAFKKYAEGAIPTRGIPRPLPDDEVPVEVVFVTGDTLTPCMEFGPDGSGGFPAGAAVDSQFDGKEIFPTPEEFVSVDELPVQVYIASPVYPDLAERAEIEGTVWVRALVDTEGRVRDAIIQRPSGSNAGFEEAAREAAFKCRYLPGKQNHRPVAVWVSYKVAFELK
jgi:TonB family protein